MHIKKKVTELVQKANQRNSEKSTGPKTALGKSVSSLNAIKHGILSYKPRFETEEAQTGFREFLTYLRRDLQPRNALEELVLHELAIAWHRRARALAYEESALKARNVAEKVLFSTIEKHGDLLGDSDIAASHNGWNIHSLKISAKQGKRERSKTSFDESDDGTEKQIEMSASFSDPMATAIRYQNATGRAFYRALRRYRVLQGREHNNEE
jgi:hypothetical protein